MPVDQFEAVLQRNWRPVSLAGEAMPAYLRGIPEELLHSVMASGGMNSGQSYHGRAIPSGELLGGIDVYRHAPDDPVELNKDWYALVIDPHDHTMVLIDGPLKDDEHWLNELPARLQGAEVLGVPKKPAA